MNLKNIASTALIGASLIGLSAGLSSCGGQGGSGGFTEAPSTRAGDTAIASVDGTLIYKSDLIREAESKNFIKAGQDFTADHPQYQTLMGQLVDQRLLARHASTDGLDKDPMVQRRLTTARERLLGNVALEKMLETNVTDDAAKKFYQEQIALRERSDEVRASHILVASEAEANKIKTRLEGGADFAKLAAELSTDRGSAAEGGDLGYFQADAMVAPFAERAFATKVGEISMPVQSQFGWHVIKVVDRRKTAVPTYEQMRDEVRQFLTYQEVETFITDLRENAEVEYLDRATEEIEPDAPQEDEAEKLTPEEATEAE